MKITPKIPRTDTYWPQTIQITPNIAPQPLDAQRLYRYNLYKCNLPLASNSRVPFSSPYQHPRPKTSSTTPRRPTLSSTCILGSHLRHPRPALVSLSNVNDENIFYHLNTILRRLVLPFALAVVLDAARAARAAAAMIIVAAMPAAAVVLFVSFVTCVVVMLWWSVRSKWR